MRARQAGSFVGLGSPRVPATPLSLPSTPLLLKSVAKMKSCPVDDHTLRSLRLTRVTPIASGMSGALVFLCAHESGAECILRIWPREMTVARLSEITRVILIAQAHLPHRIPHLYPIHPVSLSECLRRGGGSQSRHPAVLPSSLPPSSRLPLVGLQCSESPSSLHSVGPGELASYLRSSSESMWSHCDAGLWQLIERMPGQPIESDAGEEDVLKGVDALREFHEATSWFGQNNEMPLAIRSRLRRLEQLDSLLGDHPKVPKSREYTPAMVDALQEACWTWNRYRSKMKKRVFGQLTQDSNQPHVTQYVLRDIHRENLLFQHGEPSGFFDFDALRVDTPWADLSRWIGSFVEGTEEDARIWEHAAVRMVVKHPSLREEDALWGSGFAERLHEATTWLSLGNWLLWLCVENRDFDLTHDSVTNRLRRLCRLVNRLP